MGSCIQQQLSNKINHPTLGELIKCYDSKNNQKYLKICFDIKNQRKYQQWQSQIKKMKFNIQTKDFLYIPIKTHLLTNDFFHQNNLLTIYYQPYIQNFQNLVQRYKLKGHKTSEELIWHVMFSLVKTGKYFQKLNKKIGNIKLSNIIITQMKQIKIVYEKSIFKQNQDIQVNLEQIKEKTLLAPEEVNRLKGLEQDIKTSINPQLSQVFSVGLLLLSIGVLIQPCLFYRYIDDITQSRIDFEMIKQCLQKVKKQNNFSDLLIQTLKQMLQPDAQKRIKSSNLYKRLSEYEKQILSKKGIIYSKQQINKYQQQQSMNGSITNSKNYYDKKNSINNQLSFNDNRTLNNNKTGNLSLGISQITSKNDGGNYTSSNNQNFKENRYFQDIL